MPHPFEHYLLAFGGPLYGTEEWSTSLRLSAAFTDDTVSAEEDSLLAIANTLAAQWDGLPSGAAAGLRWVKYNRVGTDGKYLRSTTNLYEFDTPRTAPFGSPYPPQVSLVATLETSATRGLAHRGRMYWPAPSAALGSDGRINAAAASGAATNVAALLTSFNQIPGVGAVCVSSSTREGERRIVNGVTVGRVLDTMRSRRAQKDEERGAPAPVEPNPSGTGDF